MKPRFTVGCRFMAPDGSIATVVHVVTDYDVPIYNVTITGDPDGQDHGHIPEDALMECTGEMAFRVAAPGTNNFVPIV